MAGRGEELGASRRCQVGRERRQAMPVLNRHEHLCRQRVLAGTGMHHVRPHPHTPPRGAIQLEAWVIDDTGSENDGTSPPCVARQYSGTLGKIGNC